MDDEVLTAMVLGSLLQEAGYRVSTAYDGKEALGLYLKDPADAVITDLRMPRMTGDTLIRELRAIAPDLPIFVLTGYLQLLKENEASFVGVRVLIKPADPEQVVALLTDTLSQRQPS